LNFKRRAPQIVNGHANPASLYPNPLSGGTTNGSRISDDAAVASSSTTTTTTETTGTIGGAERRPEGEEKFVKTAVEGSKVEVFDLEMERRERSSKGIARSSSEEGEREGNRNEVCMADPSSSDVFLKNSVFSEDASIAINDDVEFFDAPDSVLSGEFVPIQIAFSIMLSFR
jgi:hypothetical protein